MFSEAVPLRDITSCTKIKSQYISSKYHYFEIIYGIGKSIELRSSSLVINGIEYINIRLICTVGFDEDSAKEYKDLSILGNKKRLILRYLREAYFP
jgi:hypothetical protein